MLYRRIKNYLKTRITDADFENTPMKKEDLYDINDNIDSNQQILHNIFNNGLVMKEMNHIGINLNQLAKKANTLNYIDKEEYNLQAKEWKQFTKKVKDKFL